MNCDHGLKVVNRELDCGADISIPQTSSLSQFTHRRTHTHTHTQTLRVMLVTLILKNHTQKHMHLLLLLINQRIFVISFFGNVHLLKFHVMILTAFETSLLLCQLVSLFTLTWPVLHMFITRPALSHVTTLTC